MSEREVFCPRCGAPSCACICPPPAPKFDHAGAAKIDQLQGELGWQKQLAAQAVRERKAAQEMVNIERARAVKAEARVRRLTIALETIRAWIWYPPTGTLIDSIDKARDIAAQALGGGDAHAPKP